MSIRWPSLWDNILSIFYPRICLGCSTALITQEELLCIQCTDLLPLTHYHHIPDNETARRLAGRISIRNATSLAYYTKEGLLQYLLHEFKYRGHKKAGYFLGQRLGLALRKTNWIKEIDLIVPVPLHQKKLFSRGYNQSEIIAERVGAVLAVPVNSRNLVRLRNTGTQTYKTRAQRVQNMEHAFTVSAPDDLRNKHILLVDDVLTTGATLESCARILEDIDGVRISIATLGIAMT